tara:strand:+ start:283 stop:822 length:540 start_codon:yes stop_codon:yes gene_type:complete
MKFTQSKILGCQIIENKVIKDNRGVFTKNFNKEIFTKNNIDVNFEESYFSLSKKDVIRGMHFQTSPHEISKLIFCSAGEILDVFLDIRQNSKTFGQYDQIKISSENGIHIYLPEGIAHGFQVLSENATIHYLQSKIYNEVSDAGILWNSFGMNWPVKNPVMSKRDQAFITFDDYKRSSR